MTNVFYKKEMDSKTIAIVQSEFDKKKKSKGIMYLLWWFTGVLGGHRFYLGNTGMGIAMLLTFGGIGFWALIDVFFIGKRLEKVNEAIEMDIINMVDRK